MKRLACVLLLFSSAAFAEERILSFQSQIQLSPKGALTVLEAIDVQVEGRQVKRGILRDFPTDYRDRFGRKLTVPFEVLEVRRDGRPEPYSVSRQANGMSVRVGIPNVMLPHGLHRYEIAYRTDFQVGFFEEHDELYWNVNGNGWTFAMDQVAAEVRVHPEIPADRIKVEAYTGPFGAKGRDYAAEAVDGGAKFRTTRRLRPGEGLTIVVMFPKGFIAAPTLRDKLGRWLGDNRGEAFGAAGFLVFLAFLFWRWVAVGRDPRAAPLFPRYEAPAGIGPAGVRFLDKMACDDRCFTAALLGLAQRGYMTIKEDRGTYTLARTGRAMDWLPGEAAVAALAPAQGAREIGPVYDPAVQTARAALETALKAHYEEKLFSKNSYSIFWGIVLACTVMILMYHLKASVFAMVLLGIPMVAALLVAAKLMPAYTAEGRRLDDEIEGLRQYLSVGEKDDLMRQKRPPRTPAEFAKFLPYAIALDVEKTWADAFASVLGAAGLAAATGGYYSSASMDHGSSFGSAGSFTDSVADMGRTISAASTPPGSASGSSSGGSSFGSSSSSSSSGGGSSGGGGGGGGGSGW